MLVAAALTLTGCHDSTNPFAPAVTDTGPPRGTATPTITAAAPTEPNQPARRALDALTTLPIKGRAPKTDYIRDQFGPTWADTDHNGCGQRDDILARDLDDETFKPGTVNCVVLTGTLRDPYTGRTILFLRGIGTSNAVQIDHVVALSDAWQKGAQQLTADERLAFATDPANLQATDGPTNAAKGDGDYATWKPPNRSYWCTYVARQIAVKAKYRLWVTQGEHDAMADTLSTCPDQQLPQESP